MDGPATEGRPHGTLLLLTSGTVLVVLADVAVKSVDRLHGLQPWFDVGLENNVPTGWTVLLLLVLATRLWRLRGQSRAWPFAALAAAALAVDEWVGWHEHLRVPGEALRQAGLSLPTYAWVLPGAVVAALCLAAATPWLRSLPVAVRRRVLLAVAVFCSGALVGDAVSGWAVRLGGSVELWRAITTVEEALEMAGVLLAVSAFARPSTARRGPVLPALSSSALP